MTKIVINSCYGGFCLSSRAVRRLAELHKKSVASIDKRTSNRADPFLVQTVEELGSEANGDLSSLKIVEIPNDVKWEIGERCGAEWVAERHRTWE